MTRNLRSKRIVIPTIAATAVLGIGGTVWATSASAGPSDAEMDRARAAALEAVGGGEVTDTEKGDEEGAYEIEVTKDDGTEVDVHLDESFEVISVEDESGDQADDADDADENDAEDRAED
ncbi:MAG: PepSY domain-containing protein [Actinomycetota bacterium]|nr:PepSY domain-containing protein [Actinomycetota bacterium]